MSLDPAYEQVQRFCDSLPRPPYEYPPGSPERAMSQVLAEGDLVAELEETIAEMDRHAEMFDDGMVRALNRAIEAAQNSIFEACEAAESTNNGTVADRLAALIAAVRGVSTKLEAAL